MCEDPSRGEEENATNKDRSKIRKRQQRQIHSVARTDTPNDAEKWDEETEVDNSNGGSDTDEQVEESEAEHGCAEAISMDGGTLKDTEPLNEY